MIIELTALFINQIISFLIGFFFIRWYIKLKGWEPSFTALIINIMWFVVDLVFGFIFYSQISQNFLYLSMFFLNILLGLPIITILYSKNSERSLEIVIFAQIVTIAITLSTFNHLIPCLIGFFIIRWYVKLKGWDKPFISALIIFITWLIIGIVVRFFSSSLISDLLIIGINTFLGYCILVIIYKNEWLRSLEIV